ncbi:MAG: molybdopterin cofactor-binding domain-containing protein, partial [Pseudomonadota bacterium]
MHYHENRFAASDAVGSRRLEDRRLLTGQGRFTANLRDSGALQPMMEDDGANGPPLAVCFVRSQPASGILNSLDIKGAQAIPGVHYVFTGADLDQLGLAAMPAVSAPEGASFFAPPERRPIASHRISFSGEIIACIVASTSQIATMAAEAVIAEIDDRDDPPWPGRNSGLHWAFEDHGECLAQAFAQADHCVELSQPSMRQIVFPMEPRAIIAWPWPGGIRLVSPSQGPVWLAQKLAEALGEQTQAVHVLTFDVGGAFGCRLPLYP